MYVTRTSPRPTALVALSVALVCSTPGPARAGGNGPRPFWARFAEGHLLGRLGAGKHTTVHAWVVAQQLLGQARLLRRHERLPFKGSSRQARQSTEVLAMLGLDHDLHALPGPLTEALGLGPKAGAKLLRISRGRPGPVHTIEVGQLSPSQWNELTTIFAKPPSEGTSANILRQDFEQGGRPGRSALVSYLMQAEMTGAQRRQWLHAAMALIRGTALPFAGEHLQSFAEHVNELPPSLRRWVIGSRAWVSLTDITSHSRSEVRPQALLDVLHGLYREISGHEPGPTPKWRDPRSWRDPHWLGFLVGNKSFFDQFEKSDFVRPDHELARSFGIPAEHLAGGSLAELGRWMPHRDARVFQLNREFAQRLGDLVQAALSRKAVEPGLDLGQLLAGQVQGLLAQMALRYPSHPLFSQ